MIRILDIYFPRDFEERYKSYRSEYGNPDLKEQKLSLGFDSTRKAQTKALEDSLAQGEHDEKLKRQVIEELKTKNDIPKGAIKLKFNPQIGTLKYGDTTHSFHRGSTGQERRLVFFRKLWDEKKVIKNGVVQIKGRPFSPETLAVQLEIINYARDFNTNGQAKNKIFSMIKNLNKILKDKNIPALIEKQNGIQLIITEK